MVRLMIVFFMVSMTLPARADEQAIRSVLADQVDAWNIGDIPAFMNGYWRSDALRFASGDRVIYGWQATLERYLTTYDTPEKRGQLSFTDLDVQLFSDDAAQVFGRWHLNLPDGSAGGLFTLTFRKIGGDWKIIADHTSS